MNFQEYIILTIIVAKGIIFNTLILGYVYVHMYLYICVYKKHGLGAIRIFNNSWNILGPN